MSTPAQAIFQPLQWLKTDTHLSRTPMPSRSHLSGQANFPPSCPSNLQLFYRGKDKVKRAVTCPNLRAILADEAYPKEWSRDARKRTVLKMRISKSIDKLWLQLY